MSVDYIIVGQGICGSLLSRELIRAGKTVLVIDENRPMTASKIASGLINPVTGKKMVTSWLSHELHPVALQTYAALSEELNSPVIQAYDLLNFHPTIDAQAIFSRRETEDDTYLYTVLNERAWEAYFTIPFGIGSVSPCYLVDVQTFINKWQQVLQSMDAYRTATFSWADCTVMPDHIVYQDIVATKIICCTGVAAMESPYFRLLPFQLNKGEALIVQIPGLPRDRIYKHGEISVVPWKEDQFWIGSIFDREYTDEYPTAAFRKRATETLDRWLRLPYTIVDHVAALRPATGGQKPFVGVHPVHTSVAILNGMGSKGCSLAPFFARQLTAHLLEGALIQPEADIGRFKNVLSRPL